jgi:osmoprotectant transport system substrate-binding protein
MRRAVVLLALAALAGCDGEEAIEVGGKDFLEQDVLAEIVAQELEALGLPVERRFHLGGTHLAHQALTGGRIDLYVEYSGTALVEILDHEPLNDPERVYDMVEREYLLRWDLVTGPALGFENTFAFVVRSGDAESLGLETIGDLASVAPTWTIGVGPEFLDRADGYPGVTAVYALQFANARQMDLGLLYRALGAGQIDVAVGNSTDGQIAAFDFVVLRDDRRFFPPYQAIPVVRRETLERHPEAWDGLQALGGTLTAETMRELNRAVVDGEDVAAVVRRWRATRDREETPADSVAPTDSAQVLESEGR